MSWKPKGKINVTEALKRVWKDIKCSSEMRIGDPGDTEEYKAMYDDDETQTVYLITNPATWKRSYSGGREILHRPQPKVLGKLGDYIEPATTTPMRLTGTGPSQESIEW